jgi:hypothetical protein
MPLGPEGLARGVLQALWDKNSPSCDNNSLFGTAISKRIAFTQLTSQRGQQPWYQQDRVCVVVDEDAAVGVPPHQPRPVEVGDQEAVGSEDGWQPDLEDPDGEYT